MLDPLKNKKPISRRTTKSMIFHHKGRRFRSILHILMSQLKIVSLQDLQTMLDTNLSDD